MLVKTAKFIVAGAALGAMGLLSACSGNAAQPGNAQANTVNAAQVQQGNTSGGGAANGDSVNCSEHGGTVGPRKVQLIADATSAGTVGCTEAFNVITEYFDKIDQSVGVNYMLKVQGWDCLTDTGAEGSHEVRCEKDGLKLHTTAPDPNTVPDTKRQEDGTGYHGQPIDPPAKKRTQEDGTGYHGQPIDPPAKRTQADGTGYHGQPIDNPDQH